MPDQHPTPVQISGHRDRICAITTDSVVHESADVVAEAYRALYADHIELARLHGTLIAENQLLHDQLGDEPMFDATLLSSIESQYQSIQASIDVIRAMVGDQS